MSAERTDKQTHPKEPKKQPNLPSNNQPNLGQDLDTQHHEGFANFRNPALPKANLVGTLLHLQRIVGNQAVIQPQS